MGLSQMELLEKEKTALQEELDALADELQRHEGKTEIKRKSIASTSPTRLSEANKIDYDRDEGYSAYMNRRFNTTTADYCDHGTRALEGNAFNSADFHRVPTILNWYANNLSKSKNSLRGRF